ncbi:uncharacterized protein PV06_00616 [Exophiala oligosperma]|uniref:DUF676 domain-containing protein n=1 Tax=Exophiala oligosperma TaxID=215243 RepID=A0A0D2DZH3_9EURO|nr:uncharacterized protein PV06_00616 [Exophiala oligosperma]KIW47970.1 hypothetical protein PV06_00616 [Exophiala oligosperma]
MAEHSTPVPYTANPLYLLLSDLWLFVKITITWPPSAGLPSIILPWCPTKYLDELALTPANIGAIFLHSLLILGQVVFLVSLVPLAFGLIPSLYFLYIIAFVLGNQLVCVLLNGRRQHTLISSNPKCVDGWPTHPSEKWVFINGVAVGRDWLQANLDRLSMIFRRPVYAIHNQTRGIIFDVLECIVQRDLNYATLDIRQAYSALTKVLSDNSVHKVVLILHSQGAIEGGMVLDWLYSSVSADEIRKLEIYTFGNASNHWNAPANGRDNSGVATIALQSSTPSNSDDGSGEALGGAQNQRLVKHIEHYANTGDYVSRFGILHFRPNKAAATRQNHDETVMAATTTTMTTTTTTTMRPSGSQSPRANNSSSASAPTGAGGTQPDSNSSGVLQINLEEEAKGENNRFIGLLFKREASGHQLNQHYLNHMFELEGVDERDMSKGCVKDKNRFMTTQVDMDVLSEWDTVQAVTSGSPASGGQSRRRHQVREYSRLWTYRNGEDPDTT